MPRIPKVWALGATFMHHLASGSRGVSGVLLLLGACRDPAHSNRLQSAPSIAWQLVETANGWGNLEHTCWLWEGTLSHPVCG